MVWNYYAEGEVGNFKVRSRPRPFGHGGDLSQPRQCGAETEGGLSEPSVLGIGEIPVHQPFDLGHLTLRGIEESSDPRPPPLFPQQHPGRLEGKQGKGTRLVQTLQAPLSLFKRHPQCHHPHFNTYPEFSAWHPRPIPGQLHLHHNR